MGFYENKKKCATTIRQWVYSEPEKRISWKDLVTRSLTETGYGEKGLKTMLKEISGDMLFINEAGELEKRE